MDVTGHVKRRKVIDKDGNEVFKLQLRAVLHYDDGTTKERTERLDLLDTESNRIKAERKSEKWKAKLKAEMKAEAEAKELRAKLQNDPLFLDAILEWIETGENLSKIRKNTRNSYLYAYKHYYSSYPPFQGVHLTEVTSKMIKQYYKDKRREGLSDNTLAKVHSNFNKFFKEKFTEDDSVLEINPMARVPAPVPEDKKVGIAYNDKQLEELLDLFKGDPLESVVRFNSYFGLRRSEIGGLLWGAVDFNNRYINIFRTRLLIGGQEELIHDTKTEASKRSLPIPPEVYDYLVQLKVTQEENKKKFGSDYDSTGYVFCWPDGSPLRLDYMTSHFNLMLKKGGLKKVRFHDLRHTVATQLLDDGNTISKVSSWMGHSRISTTTDIYHHSSQVCDEELGYSRSKHLFKKDTLPPLPGEGTLEGTPA